MDMTEEEKREMCRSNYAAQLDMLGYNPDGSGRILSAPTESPKTMNIILEVPADAYHIEFTVKTVDENEETQVFTGRMGLSEIRQARQDYLDSVKGDYAITGTVEDSVR